MKSIQVTLLLAVVSPPIVVAQGLIGIEVTATNTFESADNPGVEVNVEEFGFENDLTAFISADGVEFPNFITIYDVDFTADSVKFTWQGDAFFSGITPEGNHDRNYFTFALPDGVSIASAAFDTEASQLVNPSTLPTVELLGPNSFMTDFGGGVNRVVGFNPVFSINVVPEPSGYGQLLLGFLVAICRLGRRRR